MISVDTYEVNVVRTSFPVGVRLLADEDKDEAELELSLSLELELEVDPEEEEVEVVVEVGEVDVAVEDVFDWVVEVGVVEVELVLVVVGGWVVVVVGGLLEVVVVGGLDVVVVVSGGLVVVVTVVSGGCDVGPCVVVAESPLSVVDPLLGSALLPPLDVSPLLVDPGSAALPVKDPKDSVASFIAEDASWRFGLGRVRARKVGVDPVAEGMSSEK